MQDGAFAFRPFFFNGAYEIPLDFQSNSLIVRGHVRTIGELTPGAQSYVDNACG